MHKRRLTLSQGLETANAGHSTFRQNLSSADAQVAQVVLAGFEFADRLLSGLAVGWLTKSEAVAVEVLDALDRFSQNEHFSQSGRHRNAGVLHRYALGSPFNRQRLCD